MSRHKYITCLGWIFVVLTTATCGGKTRPSAKSGTLDLRNGLLQTNGTLLGGEWSFHAGEHRFDLDKNSPKPDFMQVPGAWNLPSGKTPILSPNGIATYELTVLLDKQSEPLALNFPNIHTAYRAYANGQLIAAVGFAGTTRDSTTPQLRPLIAPLPEPGNTLRLTIHVSNFDHRLGGLWKTPVIGTAKELQKTWQREFAFSWVEFGLYTAMAVLFFAFFVGIGYKWELFYFSLICLIAAVRSIITGERALIQIFPDLPYNINYPVEYISFVLTPTVVATMFYHFFRGNELRGFRPLLYIQQVWSLVLVTVILIFPAHIYSQIYPLGIGLLGAGALYAFAITVLRLWHSEFEARIIFPGFLVLAAAATNDYLHNANVVSTTYLATRAMLAFLLLFAVILGARVRQIFRERQKFEAENRARNDFFSTVSHELRTPLNAIYGTLQQMALEVKDQHVLKQVGVMRSGADLLLALINDILDLTRLSADKAEVRFVSLNLKQFFAEITQLFAAKAAGRNNKLILEMGDSLPDYVAFDDFKVRQILINLIGNALKFTENGQVTLRCERTPSPGNEVTLEISVKDTGSGISASDQLHIFEPFYQTESGQSTIGTGLGLSISRELARVLGSDIRVQSTIGQGSRFSFVLHARQADAPRANVAASDLPVLLRPLTILVAEDDEVSNLLLTTHLEKAGHKVVSVADGTAAVAEVRRGSFDAALLDIRMPGMDGVTVAATIRSDLALPHPMLVAITANAMPDDVARALRAGFDFVLPKPVNFQELDKTLAKLAKPGDQEL